MPLDGRLGEVRDLGVRDHIGVAYCLGQGVQPRPEDKADPRRNAALAPDEISSRLVLLACIVVSHTFTFPCWLPRCSSQPGEQIGLLVLEFLFADDSLLPQLVQVGDQFRDVSLGWFSIRGLGRWGCGDCT